MPPEGAGRQYVSSGGKASVFPVHSLTVQFTASTRYF